METIILSNSVCELLAQQLVTEQAEVVKHQGTVNIIKQAILDKKMEVVKRLVRGRMFKFEGKLVIVMKVDSYESENGFVITFTFAEEPVSATRFISLTKREKDLLNQYSEAFKYCRQGYDSYWEREVSRLGYDLGILKHRISLIEHCSQEFSFDEAKDPDFFRTTGILVNEFKGCSSRMLMLEETTLRSNR